MRVWQSGDNSDIVPEQVALSHVCPETGERYYYCVNCGKPSELLEDGEDLRRWYNQHVRIWHSDDHADDFRVPKTTSG